MKTSYLSSRFFIAACLLLVQFSMTQANADTNSDKVKIIYLSNVSEKIDNSATTVLVSSLKAELSLDRGGLNFGSVVISAQDVKSSTSPTGIFSMIHIQVKSQNSTSVHIENYVVSSSTNGKITQILEVNKTGSPIGAAKTPRLSDEVARMVNNPAKNRYVVVQMYMGAPIPDGWDDWTPQGWN